MEETQIKFNPFKKGRKIKVMPIIKTGWLGRTDHAASVMFDQTSLNITVPFDKTTRNLKQVLTKEEQEFFENNPKYDFQPGDLSHRKGERNQLEGNYWKNYNIRLNKPTDGVLKEGQALRILDISEETGDYPDYFAYKVLLANSNTNGIVAPSWDKRRSSGTYRIALVDEEEMETEEVDRYQREKKINTFLSKIDNSPTKLYEFLYICYLEDTSLSEPPLESNIDFYLRELNKLKDNKSKLLLKIIDEEKDYSLKVLIHRGIVSKALVYKRSEGITNSEGKPFGHDIMGAVKYLKDDRFNEDLLKLQYRVDDYYNKSK